MAESSIYYYFGRHADGRIEKGNMSANSESVVVNHLLAHEITPVEISKVYKKRKIWEALIPDVRVSAQDMTTLCRQLYVMLNAGVPINLALNEMVDSLSNRGFAQIVKSVVEGLEGGGNLSEEFAKHPSVFSTLFVNMINAGEQTGKLDDIFLHLSNYLEKESLLREKLVKALRYPMMMFVMAMAAIIIIAVFVIPVFADMIASAGAELPLATRILVAVSDFLRDNYLLMLVLLFSVAVSFSFHRATPKGKIFWDKFMLHTPIFGELVLKGVLGRFARSLMLVSSAGVPLLKGLSLVSGTVGNAYISLKIDKMHSKIDMGKSFLQSATEVEIFTPMILQILRVGEKTGEIEELLGHVADLYDREINSAMDNINTLIEPIMLILIGFIVLLLGLGAMLPYLEVLKSAIS